MQFSAMYSRNERTDTGAQAGAEGPRQAGSHRHNLSIPRVNGGTLFF